MCHGLPDSKNHEFDMRLDEKDTVDGCNDKESDEGDIWEKLID
jgi:hypothetical protein